jgi:DNA-binding CsgD family transcriptional regulator
MNRQVLQKMRETIILRLFSSGNRSLFEAARQFALLAMKKRFHVKAIFHLLVPVLTGNPVWL